MTPEMANRIYDVLVETCGVRDHEGHWMRQNFVFLQTSDDPPTEYRFQGALGFGGKFWRLGHRDKWDVNYYSEDQTPECDKMVEEANKKLAVLREEWEGQSNEG